MFKSIVEVFEKPFHIYNMWRFNSYVRSLNKGNCACLLCGKRIINNSSCSCLCK